MLVPMLLLAAACGGDDDDDAADSTATTAASADAGADGDAAWQQVIEDAKAEGSVTLYTNVVGLEEAIAGPFEDEYGIDVNVVRASVGELTPRLDEEISSSSAGADAVVLAAEEWINANEANLNPLSGPNAAALAEQAPDVFTDTAFVTNSVGFVILRNTDLVPEAINGYADLVNPEFDGLVGMSEPSSPIVEAYYSYVDGIAGEDFFEQLGTEGPKFYESSAAIATAVAAGEIAVAMGSSTSSAQPLVDQGAPIEVVIPEEGLFVAPNWAASLSGAAHPNAGQLLVDFLASPEGQEAQLASGTAIGPVPGTGSLDTTGVDVTTYRPSEWPESRTDPVLERVLPALGH